MLSEVDWDELVTRPGTAFAGTQTEKETEEKLDEKLDENEKYDERYDEFVNISIAKTKNVLVTEDETESDIDDVANREPIPVQVQRVLTIIIFVNIQCLARLGYDF